MGDELVTSYDELPGLIDQIAEEAIDWFMEFHGWGTRGPAGWTQFGLGFDGFIDLQGNLSISGESRGDDYYRQTFQNWRATVPEVLQKWTELPDPDSLNWRVNLLRNVMNGLLDPAELDPDDLDPEESGVSTVGNGDLHSDRATIEAKLGNMEGYAATEMYDNLVTKLDDVIRGQFAAVGVLGQHLTGQREILRTAREDTAALFGTCLNVMRARGLVGGTVDLGVVSAIFGAAAAFATGGLATGLGIIAASTGLADALLPDGSPPSAQEVELAGAASGPDEVWTNMTGALSTVHESMRGQEQDLVSRGGAAHDLIAGSPSFDLSRISGAGSEPSALPATVDGIHVDLGGLRYIAEVSIPSATESLGRTSGQITSLTLESAITRPAGIGYATNGIYDSWADLQSAIATCITGTGTELWEMRDAVIAVMAHFGQTDIEQSERYEWLQRPVGTGFGPV